MRFASTSFFDGAKVRGWGADMAAVFESVFIVLGGCLFASVPNRGTRYRGVC
jgi:hypothetical protein